MILNIILWILFGGLVGWIASLIMRTDREQGLLGNVLLGIIGAIIGGAISRALGGPGVSGFNLSSIIVALLGSIVVLALARVLFRY